MKSDVIAISSRPSKISSLKTTILICHTRTYRIAIARMFKRTALHVIIISSIITNILGMSWDKESNPFKSISRACNDFTNPLYMNLSASTNKSLIISPLSLHIVLSLVSNGAEASTRNELRSVLGYNNNELLNDEYEVLIYLLNDMKHVKLYLKNAIYVQKTDNIVQEFKDMCFNVFKTRLLETDFKNKIQAAKDINKWVKLVTSYKILYVTSPGDIIRDTKMLLLNAIYFKSKWLKTFNEEDTKPRVFHVSKTKSHFVPTMFKRTTYFYGEILDWQAKFIEIPYLNENIVMVILLPNKEIELQDLEKKFNWQKLVNERRIVNYVDLYLPKFKFEMSINLKNVLQKIGLNRMFEDNANFTRLSKLALKVNNVLQKIYIEINEEGSEVDAETDIEMKPIRTIIAPVKFVVDRPFMFAIEHKPTRLPLLLGSVREL